MSEVQRFNAVHLRIDSNNFHFKEGCEIEVVAASDYDALTIERDKLQAKIKELRGFIPKKSSRWKLGDGLPRYGFRSNESQHHLIVPMIHGYWTPWYMAHAEIKELRSILHSVKRKLHEAVAYPDSSSDKIIHALESLEYGYGRYISVPPAAEQPDTVCVPVETMQYDSPDAEALRSDRDV